MIVYGWGGGESVLGEAGTHECPACKQTSPFSARVDYKYFHIWYLFSFITGRDYFIQCDNCQNRAKIEAAMVKQQYPKDNIPFIRKRGWMIVAVPVVVLLVIGMIGGAASTRANNEKVAGYLAAPLTNDIYLANLAEIEDSGFEPGSSPTVKKGDKAFGTLKLMEIDGDDMVFATSFKAYGKESELRKALRDIKYDTDNPIVLTKNEVKELREKGIIVDVRR